MTRPSFPTDLPREDFERIRGILENACKATRPKIHDPYDVLCAVLFILRNDSAWRTIPCSFPPWRTVHHHFVQWTASPETETPLEKALCRLGLYDLALAVRTRIESRPAPLKGDWFAGIGKVPN
jgi:transposase